LDVGIFVFDEVEVLDFAGPFEVFSTATRIALRAGPDSAPPFRTSVIAADAGHVRARGGLRVVPDAEFSNHPALDVIVVPGGVVTAELGRPDVLAWLTNAAARATITASVCTGAFLLARCGLLDGRRATTHWEDAADLRTMFPAVTVIDGVRWVDEGEVVSSAGIAAGIDMSLHLVARLAGHELAKRTARQMEFDWTPRPSLDSNEA
jgi:transcriptional regulator GlxA family with amidase domain